MGNNIEINTIHNVCLIFMGLKGDLFVRIPALEAVKRKLPNANISVLVDKNNYDVLINHPDVDEVITIDRNKSSKYRYYKNTLNTILTLRRQKFDLVINFYSGGSSNLIVRAMNSRYRIGFNHTAASRRANNILVDFAHSPDDHWIIYLSHLLVPLGIDPSSVRKGSSFFLDEDGKTFAEKKLADYDEEKLVVFNLGTGSKYRRWPISSFVSLSIELNALYGIIPVVFTNPGMEQLTEDFIREIDNRVPVVHLPLTPFSREAAIMDRCYAVITGDTSLMHLSIALKKPTLCLFLETIPENVHPEDCVYIVCDLREVASYENIDIVVRDFKKLRDLI